MVNNKWIVFGKSLALLFWFLIIVNPEWLQLWCKQVGDSGSLGNGTRMMLNKHILILKKEIYYCVSDIITLYEIPSNQITSKDEGAQE